VKEGPAPAGSATLHIVRDVAVDVLRRREVFPGP